MTLNFPLKINKEDRENGKKCVCVISVDICTNICLPHLVLFQTAFPAPANYIHKDDEDQEPKKKLKANNENALLGVPEALIFKPMIGISSWEDEVRHQNVSVAIAMPAGITKKDDTKIRVLDDQSTLRVDVRMPDMLFNVQKLHSYWNRTGVTTLPMYHPKIRS